MKLLDLFSGIGGFSLGLEHAGFETVAFCEYDKKAQLVLKKHWPEIKIYDDVRTLTRQQLEADGIVRPDVICGGFPCQDISLAGKGAGLAGERSGLWFEFHRLISEIRPKYAIIENVSALRSRGLDEVLRSLAEIGYDAEWHCIPASAVGAPHRRDRIWIVAYPSSGEQSARAKEQRVLRSLPQDGAIDNNAGGRSQAYAETLAYSKIWSKWDVGKDFGEVSREINASCNPSSIGRGNDRSDNRPTIACFLREGLEGQRTLASRIAEELQDPRYSCGWTVEPNVGRVAHGVPGRVDRLKQLGNAVVPQIPEMIGRSILAYERSISQG